MPAYRHDIALSDYFMRRLISRGLVRALVILTTLVDGGSDMIRFGKGRSVRTWLLSRRLLSVTDGLTTVSGGKDDAEVQAVGRAVNVVLVTRTLGIGGVESVVSMLARGLPQQGVNATVLCEGGGATADSLRRCGVTVLEAHDRMAALAYLNGLGQISVAQLHNAPDHLIDACTEAGLPLVPVIHTTDIALTTMRWRREADVVDTARSVIAVSEVVRAFYTGHLPRPIRTQVVVIPNGVEPPLHIEDAGAARARLSRALGVDLGTSTVFACLARYEMQKNIPGLVSAFLEAADEQPDLRLVVAGPIEDWLEHALALALTRCHAAGDRIHLLGASSAAAILAAADAFIIDSFFEGGPLAAIEALMIGLPIVISEAGAAVELVGSNQERGRLVANPAGAPAAISLDLVRQARRRTTVQENRGAVIEAILGISRDIDDWRQRRVDLALEARSRFSAEVMIEAHSRVLKRVAAMPGPLR